MTHDPSYGGPGLTSDRSHHTEFDRLVEQQDQELARDGVVSPLTQQQLQAYAEGRPVPHVDLHSPEMELATARVLQSLKRYCASKADPHASAGWNGDDE
jgi:hypothetical protein